MSDDQNPNRMNIDLNFPPVDNPSDLVEPRFPSPTNGDAKKKNLVQQQSSLFDCIICMDIAKEPVVTCCGHLFCWPCLYRWLNRPSSANQCPICKGEVTVTNVTPIYGHDSNNNNTRVDNGGTRNIPARPKARRIERAMRDFPVGQLGSPDEWSTLDWIDDVMIESGLDFSDHVPFFSHSDSNDSEIWDTYVFTDINMDFNL